MKRIILKINQIQFMKKVLYLLVFAVVYVSNCLLLTVLIPVMSVFSWLLATYIDEFKRLLQYAPQGVRDIVRVYDVKGLRYNQQYLETITLDVAKMPLEEQAQYADIQTINAIKYILEYPHVCFADFDFENIKILVSNYNFFDKCLTTTMIGNIAYIAQYLPSNKKHNWFSNECFNYLSQLRANADLYLS